jgi:CHAD domain-containing protein
VSFELRAGETLRHDIHRIAGKEIEKVREYMNGSSRGSRDEMVHEVRKSLKKLRTILRLVRPGIRGKIYRRENRAFRDISRPLTDVRDATVLVEALDKTTLEREDPGHGGARSGTCGKNCSVTSGKFETRFSPTKTPSRPWTLA